MAKKNAVICRASRDRRADTMSRREDPRDSISINWCVTDVIEQARAMGKKLTKTQAREVLASIEHHHDCEIGINWTVIQGAINEYLN